MSSDALTSLDKLPQVLTDKLGRLRRRVTLWFTVDGLIRVIGVAFALIALDLLIDWFFRMDRAQRGIMLVIMIGVLLWVAWRHLVRPFPRKKRRRRMNPGIRNPWRTRRKLLLPTQMPRRVQRKKHWRHGFWGLNLAAL